MVALTVLSIFKLKKNKPHSFKNMYKVELNQYFIPEQYLNGKKDIHIHRER